MIPIKTLAYSAPMHTFLDYFPMCEEFSRRACREFDATIKQCCMDELLCLPTAADIKLLVELHNSQHNFDRMFGSLDCAHTYWKNCPKALHGSFKGKENNPLIVLKPICHYCTFFGMLPMGMSEL